MAAPTPLGAQVPIDRRAAVGPRASIRIHNLVGSTRIIGWDRDSIVLTGTVPDPRLVAFGSGPGGAKLGIETPPDDPSGGAGAHIEVRVPRAARVWVKSATADIEVSGVEGGLDLYAVSGSIVVRGPSGDLNAESMDGPITVDSAASWTRLKTASGAITVTGGDDLSVLSVSGLVTYRGTGFRRAHLESVSGDIHVAGAPDRIGRLEGESHSGRITVELPPGTGAEFDLQSLYGTIRNELTSQVPRRLPDLQGWELVFSTEVGGADIVLRSFKGELVVR